jgi:hypothetical protein
MEPQRATKPTATFRSDRMVDPSPGSSSSVLGGQMSTRHGLTGNLRGATLKRHMLFLLVGLAIALVGASALKAATNEIKFCRSTNSGWEVTAGNLPPKFPDTSCGFANLTFRKAKGKPGNLTDLPRKFGMKVQGVALDCHAYSRSDYAEFRCRGTERFVLAYNFR